MLENIQFPKIDNLRIGRHLLAFSGGADSTLCFYYLLFCGVRFDIAIVDYCSRDASKLEVQHAKSLAKKHNLTCYDKRIKLDKFNENEARNARYRFFYEILSQGGYSSLILGHNLDDRFEWLLMQFAKGSGIKDLSSGTNFLNFIIYRPLESLSRTQIREICRDLDLRYFDDASNSDEHFTRNKIRNQFSMKFVNENLSGIKRSFEILKIKDVESCIFGVNGALEIMPLSTLADSRAGVDDSVLAFFITRGECFSQLSLVFKRLGYLMSYDLFSEIVSQGFNTKIKNFIVASVDLARFSKIYEIKDEFKNSSTAVLVFREVANGKIEKKILDLARRLGISPFARSKTKIIISIFKKDL